jgi:hypothetical protein
MLALLPWFLLPSPFWRGAGSQVSGWDEVKMKKYPYTELTLILDMKI